MIHFDLPKEKSSILKVIGIGGGGGNAVNFMFSQQIEGVNFIICNTDAQALANSGIPNRVQLGPHLTQGLGAGANPDIGRQATEESLEEIKRILEVNTKMAFITAGMGGGTGTGGAPIVAKICKDLGILTVGIVTTPFAYEGKKRQQQAEEGIKILKGYVDTLLVISNDKLRHQFGNLKMREAFEKADNVLATAAKCITDVINSTGQINVDFADVCTVMRNGGVAILGNAEASGENRAQRAIEEALNSPLLNDNDIRGAKWILININSAAGEHEFTMDEVEVIQNYILTQAGENTDVILGMGYDSTLDNRIGITLIATGFEHKDPFAKRIPKKEQSKPEEKIVMVLGQVDEPEFPVTKLQVPTTVADETSLKQESLNTVNASPAANQVGQGSDHLMPTLVEEPVADNSPVMLAPVIDMTDIKEEEEAAIIHFELQPEEKMNNTILAEEDKTGLVGTITIPENDGHTNPAQPVPATSGGYLTRPSNIYAESKAEIVASVNSVSKPEGVQNTANNEEEELLDLQMQIVEREEEPPANVSIDYLIQAPLFPEVEDIYTDDETEEQKRKAAERLHKLRNLSFNVNASDPNNEFETVPAYVRRNMELYNQPATVGSSKVENFYSKYEVKTDDKNQAHISSINTFLDGKKPD